MSRFGDRRAGAFRGNRVRAFLEFRPRPEEQLALTDQQSCFGQVGLRQIGEQIIRNSVTVKSLGKSFAADPLQDSRKSDVLRTN